MSRGCWLSLCFDAEFRRLGPSLMYQAAWADIPAFCSPLTAVLRGSCSPLATVATFIALDCPFNFDCPLLPHHANRAAKVPCGFISSASGDEGTAIHQLSLQPDAPLTHPASTLPVHQLRHLFAVQAWERLRFGLAADH